LISDPKSSPVRYAPVAVLTVTLFIFAVVVAYVTLWLRSGLHEQVLRREAEALTEVASLQLANEAEALAKLGLADAPGELLNAVLKTSKLRGVFAVRVFDAEKHFSGAVPAPWSDAPPTDEEWAQLVAGKPLARLHPRESAADIVGLAPATNTKRSDDLLETWLPLKPVDSTALAGAAQLWTDGHAVALEFDALDRRLALQAALAWAAGAVMIAVLLSWAFRRLAHANRELRLRTDDLLRANRELALAAKTSALGTVAAHLMHELKNPVAGLEQFMANQIEPRGHGDSGGELAAASELTHRLRTMINDVVAVMRDEQADSRFELTCGEIIELAVAKVQSTAAARGARIRTAVETNDTLPARRTNLIGLVLHNLLQNAIEASGPGHTVRVEARADDHVIRFAVADEGPGLPLAVRERLFQPCTSTKRGGSGLGLALSQQLARQAGGRIELVRSDANGTCFQLVVELEV
jgi:signal transduction histidine kinase